MNRKGLTLVELMISMAVLVVLAALAFPLHSVVRNHVESAKCVNNLRRYGGAAMIYIGENHGLLVPPEVKVKGGTVYWPCYLTYWGYTPATAREYAMMCPAFYRVKRAKEVPPAKVTDGPWIWWVGYHTNRYFQNGTGVAGVNSKAPPARITQIKRPAGTPMFWCADTRGDADCIAGYYEQGKSTWYYKLWPAHSESFNVVFFDGHLEKLKFNRQGSYKGRAAADYTGYVWKPY